MNPESTMKTIFVKSEEKDTQTYDNPRESQLTDAADTEGVREVQSLSCPRGTLAQRQRLHRQSSL